MPTPPSGRSATWRRVSSKRREQRRRVRTSPSAQPGRGRLWPCVSAGRQETSTTRLARKPPRSLVRGGLCLRVGAGPMARCAGASALCSASSALTSNEQSLAYRRRGGVLARRSNEASVRCWSVRVPRVCPAPGRNASARQVPRVAKITASLRTISAWVHGSNAAAVTTLARALAWLLIGFVGNQFAWHVDWQSHGRIHLSATRCPCLAIPASPLDVAWR